MSEYKIMIAGVELKNISPVITAINLDSAEKIHVAMLEFNKKIETIIGRKVIAIEFKKSEYDI